MKIIHIASLALVASVLVGCSATSRLVHRHDNDYLKQSTSLPTLQLPNNVSKKHLQGFYPIPAQAVPETAPPSIIPPGSGLKPAKK